MTSGNRCLESVRDPSYRELLSTIISAAETTTDEEVVPVRAILLQQ